MQFLFRLKTNILLIRIAISAFYRRLEVSATHPRPDISHNFFFCAIDVFSLLLPQAHKVKFNRLFTLLSLSSSLPLNNSDWLSYTECRSWVASQPNFVRLCEPEKNLGSVKGEGWEALIEEERRRKIVNILTST